MKRIVLSICNSLMALSITHSLKQTAGFQVHALRSRCGGIAGECVALEADVLLMEATCGTGATLDECLKEAKLLHTLRPECKVILLCDENSTPEVARWVAMAKKDGLIDDFVYSSVSESYLTAMIHAM